jgi:steroid delta-isomerase-like uncharacterized protein
MPATPESVLRAWFDGVWNRGDASTIDRLIDADTMIHGLPTADGQPIRGPQAFRPFYEAFRSAFPDLAVEIQHVVVQGNRAVAHCRVTGRHTGAGLDVPATGRPIAIQGFAMCHVEGDRVTTAWNCFDFLTMYQQLGGELTFPAVKAAGA